MIRVKAILDLIHMTIVLVEQVGWTDERRQTLLALNEALGLAVKVA